ncbi:MAG: hypothetical protein IKE18_01375 [Oscillospiraceae bacterium]|nr:hypothetical protein [Oscillospiraceae bacterium]
MINYSGTRYTKGNDEEEYAISRRQSDPGTVRARSEVASPKITSKLSN